MTRDSRHPSAVAHVKNVLCRDPFTGTVFLFRVKRGGRLKLRELGLVREKAELAPPRPLDPLTGERSAVLRMPASIRELDRPGSKAQNVRRQLSISAFKKIGCPRYPACQKGAPAII